MSLKIPAKIPSSPGIYIFRRGSNIMYVGKAANLKKRLVSYWKKDIGSKTRELMREATKLEWIELESEIDALIKEAEYIKKYLPKYNIVMRDDKNFFYVGITKEEFPKIFITHQVHQQIARSRATRVSYLGPYTSGSALKITLRMLRNVFSYCTCQEKHKRPCLNSQIGRCPGFCCDKSKPRIIDRELSEEYGKNIKNIVAVLSGRRKRIVSELKQKMIRAAKEQNFELAGKLRDQTFGLENIISHSIFDNRQTLKRPYAWDKIQRNLEVILGVKIRRAEGYDISNISGTEATGSMVVFVDGQPKKSEYRKFKIKTVTGPNDIEMHKEVVRRRLARSEWPRPELMLIDGGRAQLNAVVEVLRKSNLFATKGFRFTKIAALAKREEELYIENRLLPIRLSTLPLETAFFFQRLRDESHRFAKKYHHKRREILYRGKHG